MHTITAPRVAPVAVPVASAAAGFSSYTAACRSCGRRLHLTDDDELLASLTAPPICWPCDMVQARLTPR